MDVPDRAIALARVEQRVLRCRRVIPAYFALDVWIDFGVHNSAIDLDCLLLKLFVQWFERVIVYQFLLWSLVRASEFLEHCILNDGSIIDLAISEAKWSTLQGATVHSLLFAGTFASTFLALALFEILHIKFDAAKFDSVAAIQFIIQIILCGLSIANNHKHFIVNILIRDRLAVLVPWCLLDQCVVLDLEAAVWLAHDDHRLGLGVDIVRFSANWDEFDVILHSQDFASSLGFDIFLGDVFRFIIKKAMWVARPCDAAHVDLILRRMRQLLL